MLAGNQEGSTARQMDDLFGPPPLMKGEDHMHTRCPSGVRTRSACAAAKLAGSWP